jgi:hypothetical protein
MTLGDALASIQQTLVANPIPAWDKFAAWVKGTGSYPKYVVSQCTAYIAPIGGAYSHINAPDFTTMSGGSFVDFLDVLITALGDSNLRMENFKTSDTSFACVIDLSSNGNELISMTFKFRE